MGLESQDMELREMICFSGNMDTLVVPGIDPRKGPWQVVGVYKKSGTQEKFPTLPCKKAAEVHAQERGLVAQLLGVIFELRSGHRA